MNGIYFQQVNYKQHMNIRRMNDRKHHKRSKRSSSKVLCNQVSYVLLVLTSFLFQENSNKQHVSFSELQDQNSSSKQLSNGMDEKHHSSRNIIRKHSHSLNKYRRLELGNWIFYYAYYIPSPKLPKTKIFVKY